MKSLVLLTAVVEHQARLCGVSLDRDIVALRARYDAEGDHFLEVVLPSLDDALLSGLENGYIVPPPDFGVRGYLPKLLLPLWQLVFDEWGDLRDDALPEAVAAIRQITRSYKKIHEVCSDEAQAQEVQKFIRTDAQLADLVFDAGAVRLLAKTIDILFGRKIRSTDWSVVSGRHGPGSVAEELDPVAKWDFGPVNDAIAGVFPLPFPTVYSEPYSSYEGAARCRLVAVPKTRTTPRLIGIEPAGHQWIQQSIKDELYRAFEKMPVCSLSSQEPNRLLAEIGSYEGELATLDLSEASDRISNDLVQRLFGQFPRFSRAIQACRTRETVLPDGTVMTLNKYASMGSALTFPVEVMVFTAITLMSVALSRGSEFSRTVRSLAKSDWIRIYGDDIIVPVEYATVVMTGLELFGLKVNRGKSFYMGHFRESCGADYFRGTNVTPVYRRRRDPSSAREASEVVSLVAFANLYHDRYGHSPIPDLVHELLREHVGLSITRHPNPSEFGGLAVVGHLEGPQRYNRALQRDEIRSYTLRTAVKPTRASDGAKLRFALDNARGSVVIEESPRDPGILPGRTLSHGVSALTHIKARWVDVR